MEDLNLYTKNKKKWLRIIFYTCFGARELFYHPYKNIFILLLISFFLASWKLLQVMCLSESFPVLLQNVFKYFIPIMLVVLFVLCFVTLLRQIGYLSARKDEAHLILAFSITDLKQYGHPILVNRKKIKRTGIIVREFYTHIPMCCWKKTLDNIEYEFQEYFVMDKLNYGRSHRIITYTMKGHRPEEREPLYDEEF